MGCRASCRSIAVPRADSRRSGPAKKSGASSTAWTSRPNRAPTGVRPGHSPLRRRRPPRRGRAAATPRSLIGGPTSWPTRSSSSLVGRGVEGSEPPTAGSSDMAENDHRRGERSRRATKEAVLRRGVGRGVPPAAPAIGVRRAEAGGGDGQRRPRALDQWGERFDDVLIGGDGHRAVLVQRSGSTPSAVRAKSTRASAVRALFCPLATTQWTGAGPGSGPRTRGAAARRPTPGRPSPSSPWPPLRSARSFLGPGRSSDGRYRDRRR